MKKFLEAGKIINKRGLSGEVKVESYCNTADDLCSLEYIFFDPDGTDKRKIFSAKQYKGFVYLKIENIDSADDADKAKNKIIYADRDDFDVSEDEVFIEDILDLPVIDIDSKRVYGILKEVTNLGASDIYKIVKDGKEYLIPAVDEIVKEINVGENILIKPIPGMFDDAEEIR